MEAKNELIGGKVIITTKPYGQEAPNRLFKLCSENGNSAYEMMFLVPPSLVEKYQNKDVVVTLKRTKDL